MKFSHKATKHSLGINKELPNMTYTKSHLQHPVSWQNKTKSANSDQHIGWFMDETKM